MQHVHADLPHVAVRPRLCFLGPLVGSNAGMITTQGEILAARFAAGGYPVVAASSSPNRYVRLADIARTVVQHRRRIDLVMLQVYGGPSFVIEDLASAVARRLRLPVVMHLRGGAMPEFMARYPRWTRRVLSRAAALVAPSAFLARALVAHGHDARTIPNLIPVEHYPFRHRTASRPRLLWMRTFHPIYNPLMAVRVLARVRETYPDATLVMAGSEKGLGDETRALAQELGVAQSVRFAGFLSLDDKIREAAEADIFINTNTVDNTPVSIIEACAFGLPVVATEVGGIPDLLAHERTGLLVPSDDVEAMAQSVIRLVREPQLASRLSAGGRSLAERSAWDGVHQEWRTLFHELRLNGSAG